MGGPAFVDGEYIEDFDNFEYTPFIYNKKLWISSEQAYQASKFLDQNYAETIRNVTSSAKIWKMGQSRSYKMKPDFDRVKEMESILRAKFSLVHLRKKLKSTKGEITFPGSDAFWGTNDGEGGQNVLGKILMKIRDEI